MIVILVCIFIVLGLLLMAVAAFGKSAWAVAAGLVLALLLFCTCELLIVIHGIRAQQAWMESQK